MKKEYYIQGDPARAKEIKAAFEKLGYNVTGFDVCNDNILFFTYKLEGGGKVISTTNVNLYTANIIKTHPDYKELELPVQPEFKVGDWVVKKDGKTFYGGNYAEQITLIEVDEKGKRLWLSSTTWVHDDDIRLWSIADAEDGDVLVLNGKPFIYSYKYEKNYCYIDDCGQFRVNFSLVLEGNCVCPAAKEQCDLLFTKMREVGYEWDEKKKKLHKIIEPKFKVGDWIVQNDNGTVSQITKVINDTDEYGEYRAYEHTNGYFAACFENEYHLWTIADEKDGDILSAKIDGDNYILIFKQIKDGWVETYGHYYITIDKFCTPTQMFCRDYQGTLYPAAQEQRDMLFAKMMEAGYTWDAGKKELKKINPHYDIANLHAGMPVLVRDDDDEEWNYLLFSHYRKKLSDHFFAGGSPWFQCIPFAGNEHLLGTTDMCDERFINW